VGPGRAGPFLAQEFAINSANWPLGSFVRQQLSSALASLAMCDATYPSALAYLAEGSLQRKNTKQHNLSMPQDPSTIRSNSAMEGEVSVKVLREISELEDIRGAWVSWPGHRESQMDR
jgi:hypothetical protein